MKFDKGDTLYIIEYCRKAGVLRNQLAYLLATAYHETAGTMKPVTEYGSQSYLKAKKYYPYIGRGYVQITWKDNYKDWSDRLGVDLVKYPDLALKKDYAVQILVDGCMKGTFTKKALPQYVNLQKSDFVGARRVVNGVDAAGKIAEYAKGYDAWLKSIGYGEGSVEPKPIDPPAAEPVEETPSWLAVLVEIIVSLFRGK